MYYKSCSNTNYKCHDGDYENNCSASKRIYRNCEGMEYLYCSNWRCLSYDTDYEDNCGAPDKFYDEYEEAQWGEEKWNNEDDWNDYEVTL